MDISQHTGDVVSAIMHASLDCIVIISNEGHVIEFNPTAERVFGYTRQQVLGQPMAEFIIPPHLRERHAQGMAHYLKTGEGPVLNKRIEIIGMRADGSLFPIELTIIPTRIDDRPVLLSFIRDITDRITSHNMLLRTSARLKMLIENLQGGVLVEDETRHIALVNDAFCKMFNIPVAPEHLIGADCSQSAEQSKAMFAEPERFVERIATILENRTHVTGEVLHLQDGRVFSRDYVPVFQNEEYTGHMWHYRDLTRDFQARRRWERLLNFEEINKEIIRLFLQLDSVDDALNQSLAMTGQLLDVSRVYVFRFRENERLLDNTHEWCAPGVNPEIDNLKGLPFDELVPSFFPLIAHFDLIAPRHINELPDDLRGILEPQDIQTVLWMPIYLDNRIEGFIGYDETRSSRDWLPEEITMARIIAESYARALEREQGARMLIRARDEAIRTAQLRAQFVANMSHEIRTPMTGTLGMLQLLLETELDEMQQEFASEAYKSSHRLLGIINDILDFSKLESGRIVLEADPIDLKAIATEVRMILKTQVKDKSIEIHLDFDPELPYRVYGDATRIRQVLMNLVGNAVKFTHQGRIVVSIKVSHISQEIAYLRFAVQDTGVGIAPQNINRIFESFVQADGSTTRKYGGSGLGLSISKQLVELMGGNITVESVLGEGSTFSFMLRLPVAQNNSAHESWNRGFSDLKILIADNNRTARYVLAQQLENWGVQVTQIQDLNELSSAQGEQTDPFDIIFRRYEQRSYDVKSLELVPHVARQVVYITDEMATQNRDEIALLRWPVDQSSLYNLLIQTLHANRAHLIPGEFVHSGEVKGRILLADDYQINIDLVTHALNDIGVVVESAKNGEEALKHLERSTYDLVLMDIQMPVMDGVDVTLHIRQSDTPYRNIPVIGLTASVMQDDQNRYEAVGINAVISKPFSINHLREVVQQWLAKVEQNRSSF